MRVGDDEDIRQRLLTLLDIYDLHRAPLEKVGAAARWQHHPAVASVKQRYEDEWLAELEALTRPGEIDDTDPINAMRSLAARDRLPRIYKWLASDADRADVVLFLAL